MDADRSASRAHYIAHLPGRPLDPGNTGPATLSEKINPVPRRTSKKINHWVKKIWPKKTKTGYWMIALYQKLS